MSAAIVAAIAQPLLVLNGNLRVVSANPAFLRQFQVDAEATVGRPVYELGNRQWDIPELRRLLEALTNGDGSVEDYRVEHAFENIGVRIMRLNAKHMPREGAPNRILLAISDDTESERLRFELEGQKDFSEKLIDSMREALLVLRSDLRVHSANGSFYERFKVGPEETVGRLIYQLGNGQWDIPELRRLLEDVLPGQTSFDDYEVEHEFHALGRRIMLLNARRLDPFDLILLAIRDITEQRRAAIRQTALLGELHHRVKNLLGNVRALAIQTRRHSLDLDGFFAAFEARLGALARAQDLLVASPPKAVALHDIVRLELAAAGADDGNNVSVDGPVVELSPQDAQAVGMTIHELATNAAKYGALLVPGARIEISWAIRRRPGRTYLSLDWRERGVPIHNTRPPKGFGSQVIEESLPHMLGGSATLTFHRDGAACRLEFPLPA